MHCPPVRPGHSDDVTGHVGQVARSLVASLHGSPPNSLIVPPSWRIRPSRIRIVVDFPAPLGPRNPCTSPRRTSRSSPSRARKLPNCLTSPSMRTMSSLMSRLDSLGAEGALGVDVDRLAGPGGHARRRLQVEPERVASWVASRSSARSLTRRNAARTRRSLLGSGDARLFHRLQHPFAHGQTSDRNSATPVGSLVSNRRRR